MAEVLRYVDPNASGSGTGVDLTNAYTSLSAWEAAEQTDLVSDGDTARVLCYNTSGTDNPDTTAFSIAGWTTDATHYITIEGGPGNRAVKNEFIITAYHLSTLNNISITINEDYTRIDGLQFLPRETGTGASKGVRHAAQTPTTNLHYISNCVFKGVCSGTGTGAGIDPGDTNTNLRIWNSYFYDFESGADSGFFGMRLDASNAPCVYNCIAENCYNGFGASSDGSAEIYNSASFNNSDDFQGTWGTIDYCASDDGDGTNAISPSGGSWANEFVDVAGEDYTLLATGNLYHGGTYNPQSGLFSTDIDGETYNNPPSVGIDEIISGDLQRKSLLDGMGGLYKSPEMTGGMQG